MTNPSTRLIHHPYQPPEGFAAPQPPIYKASTVFFKNMAAVRQRDWKNKTGYTYGLHGTPTTYLLEERIAALEHGTECLLAPSGLAAIAVVNLALLGQGDEVLIPDNGYGPNKALADDPLARWGVTHQLYDAMDVDDLAARITDRTKLVWLEAAGSVTMEFPDLIAQVKLCNKRGVLCAIDSTWSAGLAYNCFDLDGHGLAADMAVQALTKYPSGGGDVLMGSIVTRNTDLHHTLKLAHMRLGIGVSGNDAEAVLRALPSLPLRYKQQDQTARRLAEWCAEQPQVVQVLHPALEGAPGHANWLRVCGRAEQQGGGAAAGLFSIVIDERYSSARVDAFCDALQLFQLGYSWGGPISLVMAYDVADMRRGWPSQLAQGTVVRLATGLEDTADLQADLAQAMTRALGG